MVKVLVGSVVSALRMFAMVIVSLYPAGNVLVFNPVKVMVRVETTLQVREELILDGLLSADTVFVQAPFGNDN